MNRWRLLVVLQLLVVAPAQPQMSEGFVLGCNLPWLDGRMGWDLAFHKEWGYGFDQPRIEAIFAELQEIGFTAVRWWLWTDCRAGLVFDADGTVTRVQPEVFYHLDIVLNELCPKYGLSLYLCLLSSLVNTDHFGIITDPVIRQSYLDNALIPLVARYRGAPSLYAIDLFNEPEADIRGRFGNGLPKGTDEGTMRTFLRDCTAAVQAAAPEMRVSVGSGWHGAENLQRGLYRDLGLTFYDFHTYNGTGHLPTRERLNLDAPCLIGEFNVPLAATADEVKQAAIVAQFLQSALAQGYAGAFFWCYDDTAPTTRTAEKPSHSLRRADGTPKVCVETIRAFSQRLAGAAVEGGP